MDKALINHEFIANLIKETRPSNIERIEYNMSTFGYVDVRINFCVSQETLDKMLKVWYNNADR